MSDALEIYRKAMRGPPFMNVSTWTLLAEAAREWRRLGNFFSAGYAMERALQAAWGDRARIDETVGAFVTDYARCIDEAPYDDPAALAALWQSVLKSRYVVRVAADRSLERLQSELAERLRVVFEDADDAVGYLMRGIELHTDLDGSWITTVPMRAADPNVLRFDGSGAIDLVIPSAFRLLRDLGDHRGMQELAARFPDEFRHEPLKGWDVALAGLLEPALAQMCFNAAADAFEAQTPPNDDDLRAGLRGWWSSENYHLWSKYFRARAALARIPTEAAAAGTHVRLAAELLELTDAGVQHSHVTWLRILVRGLASLLSAQTLDKLPQIIDDLRQEETFAPLKEYASTRAFLVAASDAMQEFAANPAAAAVSGALNRALVLMSRLPVIGGDTVAALTPAIGEAAVKASLGPFRTWVHRLLQKIKRETVLHALFLRLAQAELPLYAHVRHGPLEYGKDIVVLTDEGGRNVLRMYQMKCGDLTMPKWRQVTNQLEEIFTVPFSSMNVTERVDERIGVLVINGHIHPIVEPVVKGWFDEQQRVFGRRFEVLHLDDLVRLIFDGRKNEFRSAVTELGLGP